MTFRVFWKAIAETQLCEIYVRADDRGAVVNAADRVVELLGRDPLDVGESRAGTNRVIIESPLSITYRFDDRSQSVLIVEVHYFIERTK